MSNMEQDRPQHRYKAFQKYEEAIGAAVKAYPTQVFITPKNLSLETVTCRLRDAANAFLKNTMWESIHVDRKKMEEVWNLMECSILGTKVRIGPKQKRGGRKGSGYLEVGQIETSKTKELVVVDPTEQVIDALLVLHGAGVLVDPTRIKQLKIPLDAMDIPPSVEVFPDGEDHIIL